MRNIILGLSFLCIVQMVNAQFVGGLGDGSSVGEANSNLSFYYGGEQDGYAHNFLQSLITFYSGGEQDGYAHLINNNEASFYLGGEKDGYTSVVELYYFYWIGLVNFKWEESGNWANTIIPKLNSRVIIPNGAPNYPIINNRLSIGANPNSRPIFCKELFIERGASINFTSTGFIENYGDILIGGDMIIHNLNPLAFQNKNNATIQILNLGRLIFE